MLSNTRGGNTRRDRLINQMFCKPVPSFMIATPKEVYLI